MARTELTGTNLVANAGTNPLAAGVYQVVDADEGMLVAGIPLERLLLHVKNNGVTVEEVLAAAASLTTALEGDNKNLTYIAKQAGAAGNDIIIGYVDRAAVLAELEIVVCGKAIIVLLADDAGTAAGASIGSGAHGTVEINAAAVGEAGNGHTVEVDADLSEIRALSAVLVGLALTVYLATEGDASATAIIGSGENGEVEIEVDAPGTPGNAYAVEVDADLTEQDRALSAALDGHALLVKLATEGNAPAEAIIGSGADGEVEIEVDAPGTEGNAYIVEVDAEVDEQDRALSAALVETALTVKLATEGDAPATATIGAGEDGAVDIEVDEPGSDGNDYTVEVDASIDEQDRPLSAALVENALLVELATKGVEFAMARIGATPASYIDITVDEPGTDGNAYTVEVVVAVGNNQNMEASIDGTDITVTLGTGEAGAPDPLKNVADLVAAEIDDLAGVSAFTPGAGTDPLTGAQGPIQFSGGENALDDDANTATLVAAEINGSTAGLTATATGEGTDPLTVSEGPTQFAGGTNKLNAVANTATLVAGAINNETAGLTATVTGEGDDPLTAAEGPTQFSGGTNKLDVVANTATLVAGAINDDTVGLTATASGLGSAPLITAEGPTQFSSGTNKLLTAANTATLVAGEIDDLPEFTVAATGNGGASLTQAEGPTEFSGGLEPAPISTADDILEAIGENEDADELVDVEHVEGSNGAGILGPMDATPLAGGLDAVEAVPAEPCVVMVKAGGYFRAGLGDLEVTVPGDGGEMLVGPFESARFEQAAGDDVLHIDFDNEDDVEIAAFRLPAGI